MGSLLWTIGAPSMEIIERWKEYLDSMIIIKTFLHK
jgi:hypothetical protein